MAQEGKVLPLKSYSNALKSWPIFSLLKPNFVKTIDMAFVFGNLGDEALIVTKDGMVYGLGTNKSGCLGTNDFHSTLYPIEVKELCGKDIKTFVACSGNPYVMALTQEGKVYNWGYNGSENIPTPISKRVGKQEETVIDVACGNNHILVLTFSGVVYAWGDNSSRQCSAPMDEQFVSLPRKVNYDLQWESIIGIACGHSFSMMVTKTGKVYGFGCNGHGQLGIGNVDTKTVEIPCVVTLLYEILIVKVVCGYSHAMALSNKGVLYAWGDNNYGELGTNKHKFSYSPLQVRTTAMGRVLDVAAIHSSHISVAMGETGAIFIWGQCRGQSVKEPTVTHFVDMNEAFACYSFPSVMYSPLMLHEKVVSNVADSLKQAFDDSTTSDLRIDVQGTPIFVHKAILKIRSQYFNGMFQKNWTEDNEDVLEHDEYSYVVYKAFLQYLYTDEINVLPEHILELMKLADSFCETELKTRCARLMKSTVTVENALSLYSTAVDYDTKELEEFCFMFALRHMTAVILTQSFNKLDESTMRNFVRKAAEAGVFNT